VSLPTSRYRPDAAPDYGHRFHAGNVGDVWKHTALVAVLAGAAADGRRVAYVDTHAGEGRYALGPTGEWTEGIGRLWDVPDLPDGAVADYVRLVRELGRRAPRPVDYPGSPALARAVLGPQAWMTLVERDEATRDALAASFAGDRNARIVLGCGLAELVPALGVAADVTVALVDPPWTQKSDWVTVPDAVVRAAGTTATLVLWYPVKSLTRPNAMIARLEAAGVAGTIAELVTTPLTHQRNRLNGSGVLVVRPPDGVLERLAAAAPVIGAACATQPGTWSFRLQAFGRP